MSRIGKMPVTVPMGVEVTIEGQDVRVKGPKGELAHTVAEPITIARGEDGSLEVGRPDDERDQQGPARPEPHAHQQHGPRCHRGLREEARDRRRRLPRHGPGPGAIELNLGFSHPVKFEAPEGITFSVESPTKFAVHGIDKQLVGEVAANIRKLRKPEPYKGKGVRYAGERVLRKAGKAGK